jgi:hypothetical protein
MPKPRMPCDWMGTAPPKVTLGPRIERHPGPQGADQSPWGPRVSGNRLEDVAVQVLVDGTWLDGWLDTWEKARRPLACLREVPDRAD